jgi:hypothetical protein
LRERTYDVISDTHLRDIGTDGSHNPRNLVTKNRGRRYDIVSSEKQVGVTQPRGLYVDEDLASDRRSDVNVFEIEASSECVKYKRLHLWPPCSYPRTNLVSKQPGDEPWAGALPASRLAVFPESV